MYNDVFMYRFYTSVACLPGHCLGNNLCQPGRIQSPENRLCAECEPGKYEWGGRSSKAKYIVNHAHGKNEFIFDQQDPKNYKQWLELGKFYKNFLQMPPPGWRHFLPIPIQ